MPQPQGSAADSQTPSLVDVMRNEFSVAKTCLRIGELLQVAAVVVAIVAVLREETGETYVAVAAFAGPMVLFILREIGARYHSAGERIRKLLLSWEGLGRKPGAEELADAHVRGATLRSFDPTLRGPYYSSNLPVGKRRLAEHVQESSFYSKEEAHTAALVYGALTALGLISTILVAWFWLREQPTTPQPTTGKQGAQLVSTLILFFGTGHAVQSMLSFQKLRDAADRIFHKTGRLKRTAESDLDELELGQILSSYDVAVAKAPPIPGWAYRLRGKQLDQTWRSHMLGTKE